MLQRKSPEPINGKATLPCYTIYQIPQSSEKERPICDSVVRFCKMETVDQQLEALAKAFVDHYYQLFDNNRQALFSLYTEASMLTFEGQKHQGAHNIAAKLSSLPFDQSRHSISTIDCQPSGPGNGILVFVSGNLQLPGEAHELRFSQMFQLMPTLQGSFYVQNDIFRLNYG